MRSRGGTSREYVDTSYDYDPAKAEIQRRALMRQPGMPGLRLPR